MMYDDPYCINPTLKSEKVKFSQNPDSKESFDLSQNIEVAASSEISNNNHDNVTETKLLENESSTVLDNGKKSFSKVEVTEHLVDSEDNNTDTLSIDSLSSNVPAKKITEKKILSMNDSTVKSEKVMDNDLKESSLQLISDPLNLTSITKKMDTDGLDRLHLEKHQSDGKSDTIINDEINFNTNDKLFTSYEESKTSESENSLPFKSISNTGLAKSSTTNFTSIHTTSMPNFNDINSSLSSKENSLPYKIKNVKQSYSYVNKNLQKANSDNALVSKVGFSINRLNTTFEKGYTNGDKAGIIKSYVEDDSLYDSPWDLGALQNQLQEKIMNNNIIKESSNRTDSRWKQKSNFEDELNTRIESIQKENLSNVKKNNFKEHQSKTFSDVYEFSGCGDGGDIDDEDGGIVYMNQQCKISKSQMKHQKPSYDKSKQHQSPKLPPRNKTQLLPLHKKLSLNPQPTQNNLQYMHQGYLQQQYSLQNDQMLRQQNLVFNKVSQQPFQPQNQSKHFQQHHSNFHRRPVPVMGGGSLLKNPQNKNINKQHFDTLEQSKHPLNISQNYNMQQFNKSISSQQLQQQNLSDLRPLEDYDSPWDYKQRDLIYTLNHEASSSKSSPEQTISSMPPPLPRFRPPLFQATNAANQTRQSGKAINSAHQPLKISNSTQQPTRSASCSFRSQLELTEKLEAKLPLEQEWWYHGPITRQEAERRLANEREGSYLIRNSESNRLDYSLSIRSSFGCVHLKIVTDDDGLFILGQFSQPFSTVSKMIQHFTVNKLPIKGSEHISLTFPVGC